MPFDVGDERYLTQIVELIDHIERRLSTLDEAQFVASRDEIDLAAFRLAAIGEATHKLSPALRARHPTIPWAAMYAMRNIIAHDYGAVVPELVWAVPGKKLTALRSMCVLELAALPC